LAGTQALLVNYS